MIKLLIRIWFISLLIKVMPRTLLLYPQVYDKVINTNMVHISINKSNAKNTFIISSSIDNLLKGAAGQAIQNFNIRFNFDEKLGLI